jgi:hypothetical protein
LFLDISFQTDRILHIYLRKRKVYNETQAADDVTLNSFTSRFKTSFEIVGAASREKVGWVSHKKNESSYADVVFKRRRICIKNRGIVYALSRPKISSVHEK